METETTPSWDEFIARQVLAQLRGESLLWRAVYRSTDWYLDGEARKILPQRHNRWMVWLYYFILPHPGHPGVERVERWYVSLAEQRVLLVRKYLYP